MHKLCLAQNRTSEGIVMRNSIPQVLVAALLVTQAGTALAYIGPGAGITAIGTAIALVGAIVLAIVGFVWYPIKRLRAKLRERKNREQGDHAAPPP
jgi:hypothetical protein